MSPLNEDQILDIFKKRNAILEGHFKLSSGLHSGKYIQCAKVLEHPDSAEVLCNTLAERFKDDDISVVIGPAMGGIVVAYELARQLGVRNIFSERNADNEMIFKRGFEILEGENCIICEDVVTTGKSTKEVIELVKKYGGNLVACASLVDRTTDIDLGVRFESLLPVEVETFKPEVCPLCKDGKELVQPGSRKKF
ncbi:MAG: orotate phosphoribosyltransferase [Elusimicrobiaceae bacterium]|jgi:orotate phosphoribosyltransferase|nr:orotate phosphoribosyltransferase [Elusimicrobiaceae bacterium]MBT4008008.1 orotate phosphoribosyltransferase [Elusimicrobiaceae bacterium]MBT4439977.1 orotate phosphoribosyltransferase [Elusimicrobiaceae bacterium]MBT5987876.1 orotate phosphoribosyltransferase [Elusimicrobiaceae bacterium]MBT6715473.1 orotate phosphoribosyltransferase [Elusimicrobiaceae bacterium]